MLRDCNSIVENIHRNPGKPVEIRENSTIAELENSRYGYLIEMLICKIPHLIFLLPFIIIEIKINEKARILRTH